MRQFAFGEEENVMRVKLMYVVFLFFLASTLGAQVTTAKFYGIVTDSSGALVPGASLTMIHESTGTMLTGTTNEVGEFAFDFLRVGSYTLRIEVAGFKKYESK